MILYTIHCYHGDGGGGGDGDGGGVERLSSVCMCVLIHYPVYTVDSTLWTNTQYTVDQYVQ